MKGDIMADTPAVFENIQDVIVIRIMDKEISHHTGESLHTQTPNCKDPDKPLKIVLDLSNITFLGSIGLTVLVVFLKRITTAGGKLVVSGLTGQSRNVMSVTKLDKAFKFYDDIEQALASLQDG
jgi:anti-anti-sigma factor|tara:strand:- start:348 stop:719 length:372 start_codon:yes stop_codon:yes gene_type:complete